MSSALEDQCSELGISEADFGGKLHIRGQDPVVASRHHLGEGMAVLLALFGMELAVIWKRRTGVSQDVSVNVRNAVSMMTSPGLNAKLRPEFDLLLVTATGPLGEMSVLPPQVELSEFKRGPRFSGDPNGASKLDWSVFTQDVPAPAKPKGSADGTPQVVLVSA